MRPKIFGAAIFAVFLSLVFVTAPVEGYYTNMPANVVIGQANFTNRTANQGGSTQPNTFSLPIQAITDRQTGKLLVADSVNNRVLIFNQIPTSNNVSADIVIGQTDFLSGNANQGGSVAANTLNGVFNIFIDSRTGKLLIGDSTNNRVLIFNQIPTSNNASADVVIGQQNFTSNSINQGGSAAANTLRSPRGISVDPATGKLIVADQGNHRVLIYNQVPTSNNASADVVIGQTNFANVSINQGGTAGANTFNVPIFTIIDPNTGKLLIPDFNNNRVLIFNQIPTSNNASADVVIGQQNFTSSSSNQGGSIGGNTLFRPDGAFLDPRTGKLFVADTTNNRTLIFNQIPTSNNASADVVIGQQNLASGGSNQGNTNADVNTISQSNSAFVDFNSNKLIIADYNNHRVLIYNNDLTAPGLSVSPPQSAENNLIKFTGNATTINHYTIRNVQYMINGGGFQGATATDGAFDSANENFFFTFDPKSNNNTTDGYTVQIKSTTSNVDTTDHLFYFQPFNLNIPANRSFISKALPTFSFSVNKQQTQLKENLSKYVVMVKKSGGDWVNYVDNIPIDFASVKDSVDNLQKTSNSDNGNGNYEDKKMLVVYSNNNSTMTVKPKAVDDQGNVNALAFDQNGKLLSNGGYEWKVQAIDKNGHVQETETRKFVVGSSQFSNGSNWFPLQINSISGLGRVYLSTIAPQLIKPKYRIQTSNPIFKGIATANSTVQLDLTNQTCLTKGEENCIQTFTANSNGSSQFSLNTSANALKTGIIYQAQFSVSQNGLFNALPPFLIGR